MQGKSLSPRIKPYLAKPKITLRKLGSFTKLSPQAYNDSANNTSSPNSQVSFGQSHHNYSNIYKSNSRLTLKIQNPVSSFNISTHKKLKAMAEKYSPQKSVKTFQNIPTESLLPLSSSDTAAQFSNYLSRYEVGELCEYETIYYLGLKAHKIRPNDKLKNKGFDDKETDYLLVLGDHIAYQYEILEMLGSGSFSQVCKCLDHKTNKEVAIKVIKSHKRFEDQGQVELKILAYLKKYNKTQPTYFVHMLNHFIFRGHLCVVFELLSFNLYDLLKANGFKGFSHTLVRRFSLQVLKGLSFLKEHKIVHCDLKPENIILINKQESLIKIIDFGSSCFENERIYTYIQSRIYRAPEVILGIPYSTGIDMWSLGCIIFELIHGDPLFQGETEEDHLNTIIEVLGFPPENLLKNASKKNKFFHLDGSVKNTVSTRGKVRVPNSKSLEDKLSTDDFVLVDFIKSKFYLECLEWEPEKRMSPEDALCHPWMVEIKKMRMKGGKNPKSPRIKIP